MSALEQIYRKRREKVLVPLGQRLEGLISDYLRDSERIDRVAVRAKSVDRFVAKASKKEGGELKYSEPLEQIQDQIGARIVTFYAKDVDEIGAVVSNYFRAVEERHVVPEADDQFGYVGHHFVLFLPSDLFDDDIPATAAPQFFELQVKTLFQHAWSEANHDLGYKSDAPLDADQARRVAFTAAQAWGADLIFNELHSETTADIE